MRNFLQETIHKIYSGRGKEKDNPMLLKEFFKSQNRELGLPQIGSALRTVAGAEGKNLFEITGVEPTLENKLLLMGNFYRIHLQSDLPSALDEEQQPEYWQMRNYTGTGIGTAEHELTLLLKGSTESNRADFDQNTHSISRHLDRSAMLSRLFIEACLEHQRIPYDDTTLFDNDPRLVEFGNNHLGGLHPFHSPVGLHYHDLPRRTGVNTSAHDSLVLPLAEEVGLISTIKQSFHEPVPIDRPLPDNFDRSAAQMFSRLADNFGKVEFKEGYGYRLRRKIEAMCAYSRERQTHYFETERNNPESMWFNQSVEALEQYLGNERHAYLIAAEEFKKLSGHNFEDFMKDVDNHSEEYGMYRT